MKKTTEELESYKQTIAKIFELIQKYHDDIAKFSNWNLSQIYEYVKNLEYIPDPKNEETVSRPKYTIKANWSGARDCDDKTVILGSWAYHKSIPFRLVVSGSKKNPHHVYPEFYILNSWVPFDATYKTCKLGKRLFEENFREVYYLKPLKF